MPVLRPPPEPKNEKDAKIDKAEQVKRAKKKKLEDEERKKKKKKNVIVDPTSKDKGQFAHLKGLKEVRRRKKGKSDLSFLLHHQTKEERSNFVSFTRKKRVKYSTTRHLLRYLLSDAGLFAMVILMIVLGTWLLMALERPAEKRRLAKRAEVGNKIKGGMDAMAKDLWEDKLGIRGKKSNGTFNPRQDRKAFQSKVGDYLEELREEVLMAIKGVDYDGQDISDRVKFNETKDKVTVNDEKLMRWSWAKTSLLYISVVGTVGLEGRMGGPDTGWGKVFLGLWMVAAAPIFWSFWGKVGHTIARAFKYFYSRCCCRPFRSARKDSETPGGLDARYRARNRVIDDKVGHETWMNTRNALVPITLVTNIMILYTFLGAKMFVEYEKWDWMDAFYFCFTTLTTIGFGDFYPEKTLSDTSKLKGVRKAGYILIYIFTGLLLMSSMFILLWRQNLAEEYRKREEEKILEDKEFIDVVMIQERKRNNINKKNKNKNIPSIVVYDY